MGHHNIHYAGDPYANSGVWSPPTSRANFCEEDYVITFYLAEFMNALTNVAYVYPALCAMYGPGGRGIFSPKWDFMSISLLVLGVTSFLFHATLRQTLEFADEFSMLGLTWSMLQATLTARQSPKRSRFISMFLAVIYGAFAIYYIQTANILHQVIAFAIALISVLLRSLYLFHWARPRFPEAKSRDWSVRLWQSAFISLFGYFIWNIDLEFCTELRALRQRLGLPWAWLLEFHGWWHILTAVGASHFMQIAREVREELEREKKLQ
ncbi:hypothetical protein VTK26DRAFT_8176 [Humicola hyalothermophila]